MGRFWNGGWYRFTDYGHCFCNLYNLRSLINKTACYKNPANPVFHGEKLLLSRLKDWNILLSVIATSWHLIGDPLLCDYVYFSSLMKGCRNPQTQWLQCYDGGEHTTHNFKQNPYMQNLSTTSLDDAVPYHLKQSWWG